MDENIVNQPRTAWQATNTAATGNLTVIQEDLVILAQWVKNDLFERVKFLYNHEQELQVNGRLYKQFVNDCKGRLLGLKVPHAVGNTVYYMWNSCGERLITRRGIS